MEDQGLPVVDFGLNGSMPAGVKFDDVRLRLRDSGLLVLRGFCRSKTFPANTSSSAIKCLGQRWPYSEASSTSSVYEHSIKMAFKDPSIILGAAASHTLTFRGSRETESGSISPKTIISVPVESLRRKNAELSTVAKAGSFPLELLSWAGVDGE